MEIRFLVKGSSEEPYEVRFVKRSETNISAYCTCMAGQNGTHCKHRINILFGITKGIVSDNIEQVGTVTSWLPGSDVEEWLYEIGSLEKELAKLKKQLTKAKKNLAVAMLD